MTTLTSLTDLIEQLGGADPDVPFEIALGGAALRGGYHVTELRLAAVRAVDCAGRGAAWQEAQAQVFDGSGGAMMTTGKFLEIAGRSMAALEGLGDAPLVVEAAPGNGGLGRYRLDQVEIGTEAVRLTLAPLTAVCRPLADHMASARDGSCCAA